MLEEEHTHTIKERGRNRWCVVILVRFLKHAGRRKIRVSSKREVQKKSSFFFNTTKNELIFVFSSTCDERMKTIEAAIDVVVGVVVGVVVVVEK